MKFLVFSDLHIHNYKRFDDNGSRLDATFECLGLMFDYAAKKGSRHILFAGDLYDQQRALPHAVVNGTIRAFTYLFDLYPEMQFYAISGNHDMATKNLIHKQAVSALEHLAEIFDNFHLLDNRSASIADNIRVHGIPYYDYKGDYEAALNQTIARLADYECIDILLIHQTPNYGNPMIAHDVEPWDNIYDYFDVTFCGHIHKPVDIRDGWYIVGSPMHRDAGDIGDSKRVLLYDTEAGITEISMAGVFPEFKKVPAEEAGLHDGYVIPIYKVDEGSQAYDARFGAEANIDDILAAYADSMGLAKEYIKIGTKILHEAQKLTEQ